MNTILKIISFNLFLNKIKNNKIHFISFSTNLKHLKHRTWELNRDTEDRP
jgi:hypothetical protein